MGFGEGAGLYGLPRTPAVYRALILSQQVTKAFALDPAMEVGAAQQAPFPPQPDPSLGLA